MAAKYSGQNALNKLMQLVKTALNGKLDVTGGTIFGDLKVKTNAEGTGNIEVEGEIRAQNGTARLRDVYATGVVHSDAMVEAPSFNLRAPLAEKSVDVTQDGDTAVKMECFDGALSKGYARLKIGTPTEDDDAVTKKYADAAHVKTEDFYVTFTRQKDSSGEYSDEYTANHTAKEIYEAYQAGKRVWQKDIYERFPITACTLLNSGEYIAYFTHFEPGNMMVSYSVNQKSDTAASTANKLVYGIIAPNPGSADNGKYLTVNGSKIAYTDLPDGITVDSVMSASSTNPVQNKVVKGYVDTKVSGLQTADQVQAAISSAITGVYTPKGSIAFKSLPTAAAGNKGWVYNVSDAFTTTAAFVEGAGHSYGAGTNVVCVDAGSGSYKWDVLAGTIDLAELTADEVQTLWDSI